MRGVTQSVTNKTARRCYRWATTGSNVMDVKKPPLDSGVEVNGYVAEVAGRLHGQVADVSSALRRSLEEQIPELRGDEALMELLGTSVEANVHTVRMPWLGGVELMQRGFWGHVEVLEHEADRARSLLDDFYAARPEPGPSVGDDPEDTPRKAKR